MGVELRPDPISATVLQSAETALADTAFQEYIDSQYDPAEWNSRQGLAKAFHGCQASDAAYLATSIIMHPEFPRTVTGGSGFWMKQEGSLTTAAGLRISFKGSTLVQYGSTQVGTGKIEIPTSEAPGEETEMTTLAEFRYERKSATSGNQVFVTESERGDWTLAIEPELKKLRTKLNRQEARKRRESSE